MNKQITKSDSGEEIKNLVSIIHKDGKKMINDWFQDMIKTINEFTEASPKRITMTKVEEIQLHVYQWIVFSDFLEVKKYLPLNLIELFNQEYIFQIFNDFPNMDFDRLISRIEKEDQMEKYLTNLFAKNLYSCSRSQINKVKYCMIQLIMCFHTISQMLLADTFGDSKTSKQLHKDFIQFTIETNKEVLKDLDNE